MPSLLRSIAPTLPDLVGPGDSRTRKTAKAGVPGKLLHDLRRAACRRSLEVEERKRPRNTHDLHAYAEVAELADALDSKSSGGHPPWGFDSPLRHSASTEPLDSAPLAPITGPEQALVDHLVSEKMKQGAENPSCHRRDLLTGPTETLCSCRTRIIVAAACIRQNRLDSVGESYGVGCGHS